jgi:hypothetical protein
MFRAPPRRHPHRGLKEGLAKLGWLGQRSITSAAAYTALAPNQFKDFWRD